MEMGRVGGNKTMGTPFSVNLKYYFEDPKEKLAHSDIKFDQFFVQFPNRKLNKLRMDQTLIDIRAFLFLPISKKIL